MHPMVNIAVRAARAAGNVIVRNTDRLDRIRVEAKGLNDFVSDVDRMAEDEIIHVIRKAYPSHGILAEEGGHSEGDEYVWVIDPLDGTTNFLHGFPHFAVSIGLKHQGRLEAGVIYDPLRQELFTASKGQGAQLDGRRIRVGKRRGIEGSLLGTGFPFRHPRYMEPYLEMFKAVSGKCQDMRRAGSAALDLAYVACGRLDGYWELGLREWDLAAGALLVQEAGGIVGGLDGGDDYLETGHIVAANPKVFHGLMQQVSRHKPTEVRIQKK